MYKLKFHEGAYIEELPAQVYKELISQLNEAQSWKILADHVAQKLGYTGDLWSRHLEQKNADASRESAASPAERLLSELSMKMCTLGILGALLRECRLFPCLSILSHSVPLEIIEHPTGQLEDTTIDIPYGQEFRVCCKAIGVPSPTYNWYHENSSLPAYRGPKLEFLVNSIAQAGEYKCEVWQVNADGSTVALTSKSVFLNITSTPVTLLEQPLPFFEIKQGDGLRISCKANGYPLPRYQWFRNNLALDGETSDTLHIKEFSAKDEGRYYCYVNNGISETHTEKCRAVLELPRLKASGKIALIIANADYENHERLRTPINDAAKIATLLEDIGFGVLSLLNLTANQMRRAMKVFCEALTDGVYGLFYYAGHGFRMQESYMLAVDSPRVYLRSDAICESEFLSMVLPSDPALLVSILDMCQTVPPRESNPHIHDEVPVVNEYVDQKNLRNLIQAYSTSNYRPSYERVTHKYGLYVEHLSKYMDKDMPVTKVFEEAGKSIDTCLKGRERRQIPMFAFNVTKPFRLTDAVYAGPQPDAVRHFHEITAFPKICQGLTFKQANVTCTLTISPYREPYLNMVKLAVTDVGTFDVRFYNSIHLKVNNLFQHPHGRECWLHNPQINEGPIVISILRDGSPVGASTLHLENYIPEVLQTLGS